MYTTDALFQTCWSLLLARGWHGFTFEDVSAAHPECDLDRMMDQFHTTQGLILAWSGRCNMAKIDPFWPLKDKLFEIIAHRLAYSQEGVGILSSAMLLGGPSFLAQLSTCVYGYFWDHLSWMSACKRAVAASTLKGIYTYALWQTLSMSYEEALAEIDGLLEMSLGVFTSHQDRQRPFSRASSIFHL